MRRYRYYYMNATKYGKLHIVQLKTKACSRDQHVVQGRGRVLVYVIASVSQDQSVSKEVLWEAVSTFWLGSRSLVEQ